MTDQLPPPPVASDLDLSNEPMPANIEWMQDMLRRPSDEAMALFSLIAAAWLQVPCTSLADDEDELARLARVTPESWRRLKDRVLDGWVKCSDGRLYHAYSSRVANAFVRSADPYLQNIAVLDPPKGRL